MQSHHQTTLITILTTLRKPRQFQVEEGLIPSLQFTAFEIEDGGSACSYNHLTIMDGDGDNLDGKELRILLQLMNRRPEYQLPPARQHNNTQKQYRQSGLYH